MSLLALLAIVTLAPGRDSLNRAVTPGPLLVPGSTRYDSVFTELTALSALPDKRGAVKGLTLKRDAGVFELDSGYVYLVGPVRGRAVGAVFLGRGQFKYAPPTFVEREQLFRFYDTREIAQPFGQLFLLFADSTAEELERGLVSTAPPTSLIIDIATIVRDGLKPLVNRGKRYVDPDVMTALLNDDRNELFLARVSDVKDGPYLFQINPYQVEEVTLSRPARGSGTGFRSGMADDQVERINQFHWSRDYAGGPHPAYDDHTRFDIAKYTVDASIAGNLDFRATVKLDLDWLVGEQRWFPFYLFSDLKVDSASWDGGTPAVVTVTNGNPFFWVERPANSQATSVLILHYHGDLLELIGPWLALKTSNGWYPSPGAEYGTNRSAYDLTFHTPKRYKFAAIGELKSSSVDRDVLTTRWVMDRPAAHASFNIGTFDEHQINDPRIPPVTVLINQEAHDHLPIFVPRQKNMREAVGEDIALSINFFQDAFGEPPSPRFYATEIIGSHGQAFPGLIHLSWATYQGMLMKKGQDEAFRAHEMAHQWWGLGVDGKTYRDTWLSEGFSEFAGWWYTEVILNDRKVMGDILKLSRERVMLRRGKSGPIWLGTRTLMANSTRQDYEPLIYQKGAWVLHMLRYLMDLENQDKFKTMMRDFYSSYRGDRASTEDFQAVVARHMGGSMDWFFDEWVYGTGIPTYEWAYTTAKRPDGKLALKIKVNQKDVPDDFVMFVPIRVEFGKQAEAVVRMMVKGPSSEFEVGIPNEPSNITFNAFDAVLADVKSVKWRN